MGTATTTKPVTPLTTLTHELAALAETGVVDEALAIWAHEHPALADVATLDTLFAALRTDDHDRNDAILIALLRVAATPGRDGELATRIVLVRFAGAVAHIVRRLVRRSSVRESSTDLQVLVLAHLWERVRCYPLHRTRLVAPNLIRDTQTAVERELGVHCRQWVTSRGQSMPREFPSEDIDTLASRSESSSELSSASESASKEVLDVLVWALEQEWLDEQSAQLLASRFFGPVSGRDGVATDRQIGVLTGVCHTSITRRRSRAERRLAAAADAYVTTRELAS